MSSSSSNTKHDQHKYAPGGSDHTGAGPTDCACGCRLEGEVNCHKCNQLFNRRCYVVEVNGQGKQTATCADCNPTRTSSGCYKRYGCEPPKISVSGKEGDGDPDEDSEYESGADDGQAELLLRSPKKRKPPEPSSNPTKQPPSKSRCKSSRKSSCKHGQTASNISATGGTGAAAAAAAAASASATGWTNAPSQDDSTFHPYRRQDDDDTTLSTRMDDQDFPLSEIPDGAEVDMSLMGTDRHVVLEWSTEVVRQFDDGRGDSLAPTVATPKGAGRMLFPYKSNGVSPFRCKRYPGGAFGVRVAPAYTEKFDDVEKYCGEQWDRQYRALRQYKEEHHHCNVSKGDKDHKQLGEWVANQRRIYRNKHEGKYSPMTTERIEMLEKIGFVWNKNKANWLEMYDKLIKYKEEHHHCNVSKGDKDHKQLGLWVKSQRKAYALLKKGTQSAMTNEPERIEMLEKIGFVWNKNKADWLEMYDKLVEYKEEHHHCNVSKGDKDHKQLGQWVVNQRADYARLKKGTQSAMTNEPERIEMLEKIGFVWNKKKADWLEMYDKLIEYKEEHHHCNVPYMYGDKDHKQLGLWVSTQRSQYRNKQEGKQSSMTNEPERIEMLEVIGFVWRLYK